MRVQLSDEQVEVLRDKLPFAEDAARRHYHSWRDARAEIERLRSRLAAAERVCECVKDLCWKATPFGHDDDGFITMYVLPSGTLHRLVGAAQGAGIAVHLRAVRDGDQ